MPRTSSRRQPPLIPDDVGHHGWSTRAMARMLAGIVLAPYLREDPEDLVVKTWPHDVQAELLTRAAVSPNTTANTPGLLVTTTGSFLQAMAPQSAASRLFDLALQLDFTGVHQFVVPYPTLLPMPIFVGEGLPMAMVTAPVGSALVGPTKKILLGTALTNELEFSTPENASVIIGRILSDHVSRNLDHYVFDDVAADALRPAGLLYGVTPITATPAAGSPLEAMTNDIANIGKAIATAGGNVESMVIVASASQAVTLRMLTSSNFTTPVFASGALPDGTVVGVDAGAIATGYSDVPQVETSKQATAHMEGVSPLPISTPGTPNVVAAPTRSAWQTDTLFLKVRMNCAWAPLLPGAVQVVEGTTW